MATGWDRGQQRAMMAVLVFAGLRIGEALALMWRDVDLARGVIRVRYSKTEAGVLEVHVVGALRDELLTYRIARNVAATSSCS